MHERGLFMDITPHLTNTAHYKCLESVEKSQHDLYLCYCGTQNCGPSHTFGPSVRNEYLVHVVVSGKGTYTLDDKTYELCAGMIFLIWPGVSTIYKADDADPWSYVWFAFNGAKAEAVLGYAGLSKDSPVSTVPDTTPYVNCVMGILEACQLTFSNEFKREAYLYTLAAQLGDDLHKNTSAASEYEYSYKTYVNHALDYIENNYYNNIRISAIADYIGINRSYLTICFKKVMNMSPHEYLIEYRIRQAKNMLKTTSLSISEIAEKVGYTDSLAFSKVFKNHIGISPKTFRRQYKNSAKEPSN